MRKSGQYKYKSVSLPDDLFEELFAIYPDLNTNRENVRTLVNGYFDFFKDRVKSLDFLEFRFLNLGTFFTKTTRLPKVRDNVIKTRERLLKSDSLNNEKVSYLVHDLKHRILELENLIEVAKKIKQGKIKRDKHETVKH
jgi:hypothetical protein